MRITAGQAKGLTIKSNKRRSLRPTSSTVRSAIFSILASMNTTLSRVLDLYAGTGALGIEALSRGAQWVDFIEQDPRSCDLIKQNLKGAGFEEQSHVYCSSVKKALSFVKGPYDLVFMDPPYGDESIGEVLLKLGSLNLSRDNTTVVVEHSRRQQLEERYGNSSRVKDRRYGDTCISIYREEAKR
ncbi:MAG: 16S rRNA (guanine(966)-N(2))-methyltransferase RsmD [Chloroflexi bacterium]|nr:16S rRNA (guanine(966)-N(2))-methyltransferase RsmD [Chloroflexota bacterium]